MRTQTPGGKACVVKIYLLLFFLVVSSAVAVSREDFVGAWMNDDSETGGITRILVKTSGASDLEVNAFGKCHPMDCDWGFASAAFSGDPFVVVYTSGPSDTTLTISLLTPTTMHIEAFYDYPDGDPRADKTEDYYFHLMKYPDFVIRRVLQPIGVLEYGTYSWIEYFIQNLGAPYTLATPLRTQLVNKERNGVPLTPSGYMAPSYTLPIETGQEISQTFAVGHDGGWTDADYTFNIMADYEGTISEEMETNNLSRRVTITVMDDYQLTGICEFNNMPMPWRTSVLPWAQLQDSEGLIPGAEFRYYSVTGRYAVNNVPSSGRVYINANYRIDETHSHYPGNYEYASSVDLSTMTPEETENHDLDFQYIIHMTDPWDNTEILPHSDPMPEHQPGILFRWDSVQGAVEYLFAVGRYRSSSHPSGPGYIDRPVEIYASETEQVVSLPVSDPDEHYAALITAKNTSGQTIGRMFRPLLSGGYGFDYRFTVDYECYSFPKLKMFIDKRSTLDIGGTLWYNHGITITNLDVVPDELFVPAPDLAACGTNTNASRTYVTFYDEDDNPLGSYCMVLDKEEINNLGFRIRQSDPLPKAVKMVLDDRRCQTTHESIYVDPWYACPVGDSNGDCITNFLDLSWVAATWLSEEDLL